jgi:hypothetical protein
VGMSLVRPASCSACLQHVNDGTAAPIQAHGGGRRTGPGRARAEDRTRDTYDSGWGNLCFTNEPEELPPVADEEEAEREPGVDSLFCDPPPPALQQPTP